MQNKKTIYINLPVLDLEKSTDFYTKLGFVKNNDWSNADASCMVWSEEITLMLLTRDFYQKFIGTKTIGFPNISSSVLLSVTLNSKEEVDNFVKIAKENGGNAYQVIIPGAEFMYNFEVEDPDGHIWEPTYIDISKMTQ